MQVEIASADPAPTRVSPHATGSLAISLTDGERRPILGNVFITIASARDGSRQSGYRYLRGRKLYLFRGLTPGPHTVTVTAAGFEGAQAMAAVAAGAEARLDLALKARPRSGLLVIDVGAELDRQSRSPSGLELPSSAAAAAGPGPASRLLAALRRDDAVRNALCAPLHALPEAKAIELRVALRLARLGFPCESATPLRLFWRIVDNRVRLGCWAAAVLRNRDVSAFAKLPAPPQVDAAVLRALDGLDALDIQGVTLLLADLLEPWRRVVEELVRSQVGVGDLLIPPGLAGQLRRRPDAEPPARIGGPRAGGRPFDEVGAAEKLNEVAQMLVGGVAGPAALWSTGDTGLEKSP